MAILDFLKSKKQSEVKNNSETIKNNENLYRETKFSERDKKIIAQRMMEDKIKEMYHIPKKTENDSKIL